jgi:glycosyltransferase involved in cell wall biosynthesis
VATDLLILYDVDGWAYHFRAQALARHAPADFRVRIASLADLDSRPADQAASPDEAGLLERHDGHRLQPAAVVPAIDRILGDTPPDVVFVLCHHQAKRVRRVVRERNWPTRIVVSWNNGWPRREAEFQSTLALADRVIVNNRDYWERAGRLPGTHPIANGVDLDTFRLVRPLVDRIPRVLWCGSEYHRHVKGYDDLIVPLFDRLQASGIACESLLVDSRGPERLDRQAMAEWYNFGTVLVCASESEGTPNTALEAAASGCTVVTTRVGNMPELIVDGVNGVFVERNVESLEWGVKRAVADSVRLATQLHADIQSWNWRTRATEFFQLFRDVISDRKPVAAADSRPDISSEVTVFVSTVGAASYPECLTHLVNQDCRFRMEVIENVAPMSAAFQQMLDRCKTPFYVQVDEDMILHPFAIRRLHDWIRAAAPDVALVVGWLWDMHLGRGIQGVKAFRHAICRRYPYSDVQSCEKDQLQRMQRDGFRYLRPPEEVPTQDDPATLGLHGAHYDPRSMFERYATLEQRRCRHPEKLAWFADHAVQFIDRFRADPSEINLMAVMGLLAGCLSGDEQVGEKDFTRYDDMPGFREALAFSAACRKTGNSETRPESAIDVRGPNSPS